MRLDAGAVRKMHRRKEGEWSYMLNGAHGPMKISCCQALFRAVQLAEKGRLPSTCIPRWSRERDRIKTWINEHGWSEKKQAYTF